VPEQAGILTITLNPTIDKSAEVDHVEPEHKLRCSAPHFEPGGGGLNVSRAIRNLGGESTALWARGGPMGAMLEMLLEEEHLTHEAVPIAGLTRENLIIFERSSKRQYRFGMPGPELSEEVGKRFLEALAHTDAEYIVASGSLSPGLSLDFYARIARTARELGKRCIVDTSGDALRQAIEEPLFLIKPNMRELQLLVQHPIDGPDEVQEAARELVDRHHCEAVAVSLGAAGMMLVTAGQVDHIPSPTVPIRSKVGAGDSTVGGIVLSLARGRTLVEAARFGVASGAAAVMTAGTELCRREDAERLYRHLQARA